MREKRNGGKGRLGALMKPKEKGKMTSHKTKKNIKKTKQNSKPLSIPNSWAWVIIP